MKIRLFGRPDGQFIDIGLPSGTNVELNGDHVQFVVGKEADAIDLHVELLGALEWATVPHRLSDIYRTYSNTVVMAVQGWPSAAYRIAILPVLLLLLACTTASAQTLPDTVRLRYTYESGMTDPVFWVDSAANSFVIWPQGFEEPINLGPANMPLVQYWETEDLEGIQVVYVSEDTTERGAPVWFAWGIYSEFFMALEVCVPQLDATYRFGDKWLLKKLFTPEEYSSKKHHNYE